MRYRNLLAAAVLATTAGTAVAADAQGYVGGSYGRATFDNDDFDGADDGYKAFIGGYGGIVGGEVGYVNFGQLGGSGGPDAEAWTIAVTAGIPLGDLARIYGKVGYAFPEVENRNLAEEIDEDEKPFWGAGVAVPVSQSIALRFEYERYDVGREDLDMASAGVELRF